MQNNSIHIDVSLIKSLITNKRVKTIDNEPKYNISNQICVYNFFSVNDVKIAEKIRKIPYYANDFYIMTEYDFIKVGNLNEKSLESIDIQKTDTNTKYLLIKYKNEEKHIEFTHFLFNLSSSKLFVLRVLDAYSGLLHTLYKLNEENICFFDLSSENIVFNESYKPILKTFSSSLLIEKLNERYISNIMQKIDCFTYKPIEIHVLFYLINMNEETLCYTLIEHITQKYIEDVSVFKLFSQKYIETYKNHCLLFLKKYINKPKTLIINDILEYFDTWDNFSLSILYLHMIGNISIVFKLKQTFMNDFIILLMNNIHPDPLKRETLENTMSAFEDLFGKCNNWTFINTISPQKMKQLHELLHT